MGMDGMSSQLEGELNRIHAETGTVNGLAIKAYAMQLFSDGYNELFVLEVARAMVMCYRYLVDETASKIRVEPDDVHTTVERDGPIRLQLAVLLKSIITKFGGNYNLYHNTISAYQDGENWDIEANTLRGFFITQLRDQSPEALAKIFCRQFNPEQFKEYYKNAKLTGDIYLKTMAAVKAFTAVCLLSAEFPGKVLWDGGYCTVQRAVDLEGMVQRYPPPEQWDPGKTVLTPQGIVDSAALGRPHPDYATPTAQKGKIILQYPHLSISHVHTAYLFSSILCRDNQTSTKDPNILRAEHEFICDLTGCPAHVVEVAPKLNDGPTKK
jgi:hypothetical protein